MTIIAKWKHHRQIRKNINQANGEQRKIINFNENKKNSYLNGKTRENRKLKKEKIIVIAHNLNGPMSSEK